MTTYTALIVTHANRIKQVLATLGVRDYEPVNCAVIRILFSYIGSTYNVSINQLRGAGVENDERMQLHNGVVSTDKLQSFIPVSIVKSQHTFEYYLVRHGEGFHNIKTFKEKWANLSRRDPELTPVGIQQAFAAGKFIGSLHINFNVYFVSPLQRTHLTLLHIMRGFYDGKSRPSSITAIVLPLSEEISAAMNPGKENTSDCFTDRTVHDTDRCHTISSTQPNNPMTINIVWDLWQMVITEILYFRSNTMLYFAATYLTGEIVEGIDKVTRKGKSPSKDPRSKSPRSKSPRSKSPRSKQQLTNHGGKKKYRATKRRNRNHLNGRRTRRRSRNVT
jgi:hypothetical protein